MCRTLALKRRSKVKALPRKSVLQELTKRYCGDELLAKRSYLRAMFRTLVSQNLSILASDGTVLDLELKDNGKGRLVAVGMPQTSRDKETTRISSAAKPENVGSINKRSPAVVVRTSGLGKAMRTGSIDGNPTISPMASSKSLQRAVQSHSPATQKNLMFSPPTSRKRRSSWEAAHCEDDTIPYQKMRRTDMKITQTRSEKDALEVLASICTISKK